MPFNVNNRFDVLNNSAQEFKSQDNCRSDCNGGTEIISLVRSKPRVVMTVKPSAMPISQSSGCNEGCKLSNLY